MADLAFRKAAIRLAGKDGTTKEGASFLRAAERLVEKARASETTASRILHKTGVYDQRGKLKKKI